MIRREWMATKQASVKERKELGKEKRREKKGKKWFEGKERLFAFV